MTTTTQTNLNLTSLNLQLFNAQLDPAQLQQARGLLSYFPDLYGATSANSGGTAFPSFSLLPPPGDSGNSPYLLALGALRNNPFSSGLGGDYGASIRGMALNYQSLLSRQDILPVKPGDVKEPRSDKDEFATHQSCRTGKDNPSNLNDSDHIKLAIYSILERSDEKRAGFKALAPAELQKKLKEEYGIESELTKVKSKEGDELTALKFANGAVFADGAGDGKLDTGDYNFKGAIDDIKKRYGLDDEGLKQVDEAMRSVRTEEKQYLKTLEDSYPDFKKLPPEMQSYLAEMFSGGTYRPTSAEDAFNGAMRIHGGDPSSAAYSNDIIGLILKAWGLLPPEDEVPVPPQTAALKQVRQ